MTIGERIKQRRIELGLSQDELSRKMGYQTRNAIYQFEQKDNMKLSLIEKFAEALDTTPGYLMGWEDESPDHVVSSDLESEALELWHQYEGLTPEKQAAFLNYLKFLQSDT